MPETPEVVVDGAKLTPLAALPPVEAELAAIEPARPAEPQHACVLLADDSSSSTARSIGAAAAARSGDIACSTAEHNMVGIQSCDTRQRSCLLMSGQCRHACDLHARTARASGNSSQAGCEAENAPERCS
jgi:hypothetical protein